MKGKLYSVGVGPGDPELMTLKAVRLIKECDVLAIPQGDSDVLVAKNIKYCGRNRRPEQKGTAFGLYADGKGS